ASYVHNAASPELGKIGVLVALKSEADPSRLSPFAKQLAMHVAAASPLAITAAHLPKEVVERERNVQRELARQSGKPEAVIEKMMEGRMRKFYEDTTLLAQTFVIDGKSCVSDAIEKAAMDLGAPIAVEGFVRFQVGEGVEKAESDFAGEVAQMAGTR
ncbi:MAG: translation elongation factor Ts, partial [Rhizomicrobium sp.]